MKPGQTLQSVLIYCTQIQVNLGGGVFIRLGDFSEASQNKNPTPWGFSRGTHVRKVRKPLIELMYALYHQTLEVTNLVKEDSNTVAVMILSRSM